MLESLGISIVADVVKNVFASLPRAWTTWKLKQFFGNSAVNGNDCYIVVDPYEHPINRKDLRQGENRYIKKFSGRKSDMPLVGEDDVMGVNIVRVVTRAINALSSYRKPVNPLPIILDKDVTNTWNGSYLCFGSSDSNIKTYDIENLPENDMYQFEFNNRGRRHFIVRGTAYDTEGRNDVGIICKLRNPHAQQHWLIVCAGLGEWGTSGSARYLFSNWENIYSEMKKKNFIKVIRVNVDEGDESAREIFSYSE